MRSISHDSPVSPMRKLRIALLVMFLIVLMGTAGFHFLEKMSLLNALYMTIITISTVGFREVGPLDTAGQILTIGIIVVSFFVAAAIITFLGQLAVEGHFRDIVARRKMERVLDKINDHFIIAGYGRVGRYVAREFTNKKTKFVIIEQGTESVNKIIDEGYLFVTGDATNDDVLISAGIERAHTLVSTLPDEAQNVYLTLTARHMNSSMRIIARADFEDGEKKLIRAGADQVIIPHVLGGIRMAKAALQPNVMDFMRMTAGGDSGLLVEELVVPRDSKLDGKTMVNSRLKEDYGVTIVGIRQNNQELQVNPAPQTMLAAGDILVLLGETDSLERLSNDLGS